MAGLSSGYPSAIIPTGFTYSGSSNILDILSSSNAPTNPAPIPSFTAIGLALETSANADNEDFATEIERIAVGTIAKSPCRA